MGLLQRLEMRQGQALVMTPQLLQAIKLLQLSHLDLVSYVAAELERNPLLETAPDAPDAAPAASGIDSEAAPRDAALERGDIAQSVEDHLGNAFPDDQRTPDPQGAGASLSLTGSAWQTSGGGGFEGEDFDPTANLTDDPTLHEHLLRQLDLATGKPMERLIGRHIVDAVDGSGYLSESCEAIAERLGIDLVEVERMLDLVQTFTPSGVAARGLAECLAIQLKERGRYDPAIGALLSRLDLVARRDVGALKRVCGVEDEDIGEMLAEIRQLDPKPGRAFGGGPVQLLVPDVFVRAAPDGSWIVELNPDTLPRVLVNQAYHARVSRTARNDADKTFISDCLQSANWLTRSLEQRSRTILKVAIEIVRQQDGFFAYGVQQLRPLNLKTVADAIGMHESTVSRVTSNKAIGTARGTFEMKYFFTASIPAAAGGEAHSSEAVRHRIKQLVDGEGQEDVLSDDALVKRLRGEGIDIARRTVAKYRESLRIPSSVDRRRDKKVVGLRA